MSDDASERAQRIAEIRARCEKATPGPWYFTAIPADEGNVCIKHDHVDLYRMDGKPVVLCNEPGLTTARLEMRECNVGCLLLQEEKRDAEFIANARQDIPWLLELLYQDVPVTGKVAYSCKDCSAIYPEESVPSDFLCVRLNGEAVKCSGPLTKCPF